MGRDEVRRRTFGLFDLLFRARARVLLYSLVFLPSLPSPASYILAIIAPFTPCFWHFSQICLHPQISADERLAGHGEGVKAKTQTIVEYTRA